MNMVTGMLVGSLSRLTGTCKNPFSPMVDPSHVDTRASSSKYIPKLEFPLFDGDNPRLWKDK